MASDSEIETSPVVAPRAIGGQPAPPPALGPLSLPIPPRRHQISPVGKALSAWAAAGPPLSSAWWWSAWDDFVGQRHHAAWGMAALQQLLHRVEGWSDSGGACLVMAEARLAS